MKKVMSRPIVGAWALVAIASIPVAFVAFIVWVVVWDHSIKEDCADACEPFISAHIGEACVCKHDGGVWVQAATTGAAP